MRAGFIALAGLVSILVTACGAATQGSRGFTDVPKDDSKVYSQTRTASCLHARNILYLDGTPPFAPAMSKAFPTGVTGFIALIRGGDNSRPDPRTGPPIGSGVLVFLRTHTLARTGEAKLWRFFESSPGGLFVRPPSNIAPTLQFVHGNVVLLWDYPCRHHALSNKLIALCLRSRS